MGVELRGLSGKTVLITGAGRGQGANHARAFAEAGCDVAAVDICAPIEVFSAQGKLPGPKWRAEMEGITDAVLLLASENAQMITGHVLHVDCGQATR